MQGSLSSQGRGALGVPDSGYKCGLKVRRPSTCLMKLPYSDM